MTAIPPVADPTHTYMLCLSRDSSGVISNISVYSDGRILLNLSKLRDDPDTKSVLTPLRTITTTVEDCAFNVYAMAKQPKPPQLSIRALLIGTSSDGLTVRVGNQIFLPEPKHDICHRKPFWPKDISLCLDHIEQRGRFLVITSRHKVTTVPEASDHSLDSPAEPESDKPAEQTLGTKGTSNTSPNDCKVTSTATSTEPAMDSPRRQDFSDDASSEADSDNDSSTEDEELSAYESWSEASTENAEDEVLPNLRPGLALAGSSVQATAATTTTTTNEPSSDEDSGSSDSDSNNDLPNDASSNDDSDSDSGSSLKAEAETTRFAATAMDSDEDSRMWEEVFIHDRDGPAADSDSNDDSAPAGFWEDNGCDFVSEDEDFDGFQAMQSDSEDCSECGEDGGACAVPPANADDGNEAEEESGAPLGGTPMAQIHVYDVNTEDADGQPHRVFRYTCPTATTPVLDNSPPALHPTKALVVWPLGDDKLLFADYEGNTYFIKKIRVSTPWSQHISIAPRFSPDGQYLHVVAVEKQGRPPSRPRKTKKLKGEAQAQRENSEEKKKKKGEPKYDLVVLTFRLSRRKTTRAPPVLVRRDQIYLGPSGQPPACTWTDDEISVSGTSAEGKLEVYKIKLFATERLGITVGGRQKSPATHTNAMEKLWVQLPAWAVGRGTRYLPAARHDGKPAIMVTSALQHLNPVKSVNADAQLDAPMAEASSDGHAPDKLESDDEVKRLTVNLGNSSSVTPNGGEVVNNKDEAPQHASIMIGFLDEVEHGSQWLADHKGTTPVDLSSDSWWVEV